MFCHKNCKKLWEIRKIFLLEILFCCIKSRIYLLDLLVYFSAAYVTLILFFYRKFKYIGAVPFCQICCLYEGDVDSPDSPVYPVRICIVSVINSHKRYVYRKQENFWWEHGDSHFKYLPLQIFFENPLHCVFLYRFNKFPVTREFCFSTIF